MSDLHPRCPLVLAAVLATLVLALPPAMAQSKSKRDSAEKWRIDPYTNNDKEAMKAAGYVSYGPFSFAGFPTRQIEHVLGDEVHMLWAESAHFKIGVHLGSYSVSRAEREEKKKIRAELTRLKAKLPKVKPRISKLDPWLRLHLFVQRAEDLYADFERRLGVSDEDFPKTPETLVNGRYMGAGPYLGQPLKFTILLTYKTSTFGHFCRTFFHRSPETPIRHNALPQGSLFYGLAAELLEGKFRSDTGLHCQLVYNVAHNLADGFKGYTRELPVWWAEGLAHWYCRRISPRYPTANVKRYYQIDPDRVWNWAPRVRARAKFDHFPRAKDLLRVRDYKKLNFIDTMMVWSRVDFLMSLGDEGFATFMDLMSGKIPAAGPMPSWEEILARQDEALQQAWDLDAASFDKRWRAYVLAKYDKK